MIDIIKGILVFIVLVTSSTGTKKSDVTVESLAEQLNTPAAVVWWVHRNIWYKSDWEVWGVPDYWQTSEETLELRSCDCEDMAVLFYDILMAKKIPAVILAVYKQGEGHAVCIYKYNDNLYLADTGRNIRLDKNASVQDICQYIYKDWRIYRLYDTKHIKNGKNRWYRLGFKTSKDYYLFQ